MTEPNKTPKTQKARPRERDGPLGQKFYEKTGLMPVRAYTLKEEPQPQVLLTWGLSNLKPAASRVST